MLSCRVGGVWKFENLWSNCALGIRFDQELGICYFYTYLNLICAIRLLFAYLMCN